MYETKHNCSLLLLLLLNLIFTCDSLSKSDFKIWGPGLKPHLITMPARYFFIEPTSTLGCGEDNFNVEITGMTSRKKPCRIWTNVLSIKPCSYIVRYKLYEICQGLAIDVKYKAKHVAESPYEISNVIYPEDCSCPVKDLKTYLEAWECGSTPRQITKDLNIFKDIDFDVVRQKIIKKYDNPGAISLCHYVIKSQGIYRKCYGKYVGFKMFMDSILLSLSRKVKLPDLEFFVNLGDWPLVNDQQDIFPIFSWCGSTNSYDIVMPTYDITEATLENMGRVMLDMLSVQGNAKKNWQDRIPKVFWRGRDSNRERLDLIDISREHPDLFNVSLTNFFFFRTEEEKYGPKTDHVSFFSFFDYKYQLGIDGTVAAYRLPYLLAGGSLLLKQDSKYYEHFYKELIPDVHYVSVKKDLSDLVAKIEWAIDNDDKAKAIAESGQDFAKKNLLPKDIFCYHVHLLDEFSKKIVSKIKILEDMEKVEDTKGQECSCDQSNKDEL